MKNLADFKGIKAAVLTVSDSCSRGERKDVSGEALCRLLKKLGAEVLKKEIVSDDKEQIKKKLKFFADKVKSDIVLSCGGTGLGPRDVTPEATGALIEKEAKGLSELMRFEGIKKTKRASLSRGVAGTRKRALIINLPGSPNGACESFLAIAELIPHALMMMRGQGHEKVQRPSRKTGSR